MSGMAGAQRGAKSEPPPGGAGKPRLIGGAILIAGAVLTALLLAFILGSGSSMKGGAELTAVAPAELDAAAVSLYSDQAAQRIADAKSCKAPLAILAISRRAGSPDSTIRISSGDYVSPPFKVTEVPQRVAVPFPAPYPVGKGVLSVLGEGNDLSIWLTPGWSVEQLSGAATIDVVWNPKPNC